MESRTIPIKMFYTCEEQIKKRWNEQGRKNQFSAKSIEEFQEWKESVRKILKELIGLDRMESCSLNPQCLERVEIEDGIIREKILIQVEPEVYMPVYVLIPPKKGEEKLSCFLAPCGHQGAGKYSVAGVRDIPAVADKIELFHYDYGLKMAKLGYVALCPDARGFGERREKALQGEEEDEFINSTCFHLAHMAEPLGMTLAGMNTWDLMRLLDYVEERGEWDIDTIGCVGFSGGGMQTFWLSALDDRVKKIIISGYFYGVEDSLLKLNGNCSCNYVPHLWEHVDMGDMGALLAPRPLMIQSGREDHLNGERGIMNVEEQLLVVKDAYNLFGMEDRIYHDVWDGGHCFHQEHIEEFLMR
jgi:dienelactone hydrolase